MVVTRQAQDVGGSQTISTADWAIHGGRIGDGRLLMDNLTIGSAAGQGANRSRYIANVGTTQETTVTTSGGLGEAETAGVAMNLVPREGGNTVRGSLFVGYANSAMQGSNFTDALRATGLASPNELEKVWEVTPQVGGPIFRDRLWYFVGARHQGTRNWIAGMYQNLNAGDPTKWMYEPDVSQRALDDGTWKSLSARFTWQVSARNKVNLFWDEQDSKSRWVGGGTATASPEADRRDFSNPNRVGQVTWSSPLTNRLLLEAGFSLHQLQWGRKDPPAGWDRSIISVTEQAGINPGLVYRAEPEWTSNWFGTYPLRAAVSYVTGTHTSKFGFQRVLYTQDNWTITGPNPLRYRFNNGVPNQVTLSGAPRHVEGRINTMAVYAQDSWVLGRLTLQGGLRYDHQASSFPEQVVGFTQFIPNGFVVPETDGVNFHDVTPRMAATYDLAGDGRTAIKVTLGKYVLAQDGGGALGNGLNPTSRLGGSTVNRAWNDTNRNFVADCDLLNPVANGECGAFSNVNFGRNLYTNSYDATVIEGWGVRPYQWEFSAALQREIIPRVAGSIGYFRRWYGNFIITDNRAVGPEDFNTFSVAVPSDTRLPNGGGYTLDGFLNVTPQKFGLVDNYITRASSFGKINEHWQGLDFNVNARTTNGLTVQGGVSTGRTVLDECDIASQLPELYVSRETSVVAFRTVGSAAAPRSFCKTQEPFLTQVKGLASYTIPRIEVLVSATYRNNPGEMLDANFAAPNALVAPSLGRPLAGNAANVTVNLVKPGELYGDRLNQLDLRFAKVLRVGRMRTNVGVDLYNATNGNPVTTYNQTFGPRYLTPTLIMPARFAKFSVQMDW
jgi:hypothetical protein